jgi:TetR/AcrR family transcriptional regulator of autoinduction and epiphytic fitness
VSGRPNDQKREAILEAAARAFREDGYYETTMDAEAERAGVSKRTVYNHFPSKDALFDVVTEAMWSHLQPSDEPPPLPDAPVGERLTELAERRLRALLDPELIALLRVVLAESVRAPELARAFVGQRDRDAHLGLRAVLADERERGRLHIDELDLAAGQFWGMVMNPLFWPLVLGLRDVPDEREQKAAVASAVSMFLAHYAPSPRTTPRRRT